MTVQKDKSKKAFATYLLLSVLPSSIKFFLLPIYVNFLTPEDYGALSILNVFAAAYAIMGCLQFNIPASVNYFKVDDKTGFEKSIFSSAIFIAFGSFLVFLLLGSTVLGTYFQNSVGGFFPLGIMALANAFLGQVHVVFFVFLRNKYQLRQLTFYSVLLVVSSSVLQFVLIVFFKQGVFGSLMGSLVSTAIVVLFILIKNHHLLTFSIDRMVYKGALAISLPMIPAVLIDVVMKYSDRVFLERLMSMEAVGLYTVLSNIFILVSTVSVAFASAIKPILYTQFEDIQKNKREIEGTISSFVKIILLTLSGIILIGSNLNLILDQEKYLSIIPYFALAGMMAIPNLIIQIPHLEMLYSNQSKRISQATLVGALVQMALLTVLIPRFQINGVLMALGIAGLIHFAIAYRFFYKSKVPHHALRNLLHVILFVVMISSFKLARDSFEFSYNIFGIGQFLIFGIGLAMVSKQEIRQLYQYIYSWKKN